MKKPISYFYGSFASAIIGVIFGFWFAGMSGAWTVFVLAVLETSLSLDNAVVNAQVLGNWNRKWRQMFIYIGLPIAVFGMRLLFPILIVSVTTDRGILETYQLAVNAPDDYTSALANAHNLIAAFGGSFLMMVAFTFFFDEEKENHWLPVEKSCANIVKRFELGDIVPTGYFSLITIIFVGIASLTCSGTERILFCIAGLSGLATYLIVKGAAHKLSANKESGAVIAQGIGGLLYLEVLDASFSFDGVVGAFAISNNLFIIMAGLGVGAMFVRSLTLFLVDKGTLSEYRYLENGAFWAIFALAIIMLVSVKVEIPDWFTGFIGAGFIAAALSSSILDNKKSVTA